MCLPPEICSPIPTPTRFVLGSGLVEAARAENAIVCTGCKSCSAAACLAARSEVICLSERPVKMIVELIEAERFAELLAFLLDFLVAIKCSLSLGEDGFERG